MSGKKISKSDPKTLPFEVSRTLRETFNQHFEEWRRRSGGTLDQLAFRCGVSPGYLSHVRRYGRIPGRPVLILLALNFGISGSELYRQAGILEPFPLDPELGLGKQQAQAGFISFKLDMDGFTGAIRSIVRSEMHTRSVKDLLGSRPIRIGMNYHQYWLFDRAEPPNDGKHTGLFAEFCDMLGTALQKEIELVTVPFASYIEQLQRGQIDLFGPTMVVPNLPGDILFTQPVYKMGVSGIWRKRRANDLENLATPKTLDDVRTKPYEIAVLKNSLPHLLANTLLQRTDSSLILVTSDEEGIERTLLKGLNRPAHIFLTNSITAALTVRKTPEEFGLLFGSRRTLLDLADNSIAVRPDWPEVIPTINDAISFLRSRGGLVERLQKLHGGELSELVEI